MNLLRNLIPVRIYIISFLEGLIAAACFTAAVFVNRPIDAPIFFEYEAGALAVATVAVLTVILSYVLDFYKRAHIRSPLIVVLDASQLIGLLLMANAALAFAQFEPLLRQSEVLLGTAFLLGALILWRLVARPAIWRAFGVQRVLFVGHSPTSEDIAAELATNPARGMAVCGYIVDPGQTPPGKVLGAPDRAAEIIEEVAPDRIVVDGTVTDPAVLKQLMTAGAAGVPVQTASQAYEWIFARVDCRGLHPYTVLFLEDLKGRPASLAVQSIYTNLLALASIVLAAPLILLIGILLRIGRSGRPVFTSHECVGLYGIPLKLYQFYCPADDSSLVVRMLRRFKLYGLPQIINLVRGELSLIGPRPEQKDFEAVLEQIIPFYAQRHVVRPGIFGWSQLHCDSSEHENTRIRLEYDLYYIKNVSVGLDIYIMVRALHSILSRGPSRVSTGIGAQAPSITA